MNDLSLPKRHIVVVSFDDNYATALVGELEELCPAVHVAPLLRTLKRSIDSLQPTAVVFDLQSVKTEEHSIFDIISSITDTFPDIRKIAIGHQSLPSQVVSAMKAGANDFVDRQASPDEVRQAVARQLRQVRMTPSERAGRVLALASARENEGVNSIAASLATWMAASNPAREVLLLDLNLEPSLLEVEFDVEITYSVRDALNELLRLDKSALHNVIVRHSCGLYLLPLTARNRTEEEISPQDLATLVGLLRNYFSTIIVKAGCLRDRYCQSYLVPLFDKIVVVCPQLIGSVRDARTLIADEFRDGEYEQKFALVVSNYDADILLGPDQIKARIGFPLIGTVPNMTVALANSHNQGVPLMLTAGSGRYGRAIQNIAKVLLPEQPSEAGMEAPHPADRIFDWFGRLKRAVT